MNRVKYRSSLRPSISHSAVGDRQVSEAICASLSYRDFARFARCDQAPTFSINPTRGWPEMEGTVERRVSLKLYLSKIWETRDSGSSVCRATADSVLHV